MWMSPWGLRWPQVIYRCWLVHPIRSSLALYVFESLDTHLRKSSSSAPLICSVVLVIVKTNCCCPVVWDGIWASTDEEFPFFKTCSSSWDQNISSTSSGCLTLLATHEPCGCHLGVWDGRRSSTDAGWSIRSDLALPYMFLKAWTLILEKAVRLHRWFARWFLWLLRPTVAVLWSGMAFGHLQMLTLLFDE